MSTSKQAQAAAAVVEANREALVGFDSNVVHTALKAMSDSKAMTDAATGELTEAAVVLISHAADVAVQSRAVGATDLDKAWSRQVKAMLPMLAKEGSRFVKVTETDDGARYLLSGYGQNVNSVARGFCQYDDIAPADATNEDGIITYGGLLTVVQERRKLDRTDEEVALAEAKELLAEAIKAYRADAVKGNDAARIIAYAEILSSSTEITEEEGADDGRDIDAELASLIAVTPPAAATGS